MKEAGTSCEGLSPGNLGMQGQVPGGRNQVTTNKTPLNADKKDLELVWKLQALIGFHVNHQMISILTTTIKKDKHGQRH